ncbi:Nif3-like dinuclear metal center hexameric protein [Brevibacterium sp. HMSC07C04]|uniref:Nif3-like dinuclear metal center hexameric protein n=1 Tax=Brevibacterium sp. HMSC07C04 TaxID=1581130 RepID=UPI0008A1C1CE|nr:Nif3-like dinuclear metal center hexameric protein [Brevibacterium sp. HMSC07C04]OFS26343.1 Nif3-like dinuclear metal center hexameric protein [Brevibacterium sp. HMSC07C04]
MTNVRDVMGVCEQLWPKNLAEDWDSVGLAVGDPESAVTHVHCALDPSDDVIAEAVELGADFLFTHHPLLLRGVTSVAADTLKGGAVHTLIQSGIAQFNAHTNADSVLGGVSDVLADILQLQDVQPLVQHPEADEGVGLGRVGTVEPTSVEDIAVRLAQGVDLSVRGIAIGGDPSAEVTRIAVLGGAGDSMFGAARKARAQLYVTSDLRHHPASEALDTGARGGPLEHLIDISHYSAESAWIPRAAEQLDEALRSGGHSVTVTVSDVCSDPWSAVVLPDSEEWQWN